MVDTNLDKGERKSRGQTYFCITTDELVQLTIKALEVDEHEIRVTDPKLENFMRHGQGRHS
jgi:hypothetical protein